jgi:hypothetical protein
MLPQRNAQLFAQVCADVLARAYDAFPSTIDVDPRALGMGAAVAANSDEAEGWKHLTETASEAIDCLMDQGVIETITDSRGWSGGDLKGVHLTHLGHELLGSAAAQPDKRSDLPLVQLLREALAMRSREMVVDAVKLLLRVHADH